MPGGAPDLEGPPSETVRGIDHNGRWMVFWYLEQVPEYGALLDDCLDEAQTYLPRAVGPMYQREAFLFLSAPGAVTPVHFDPEHNFLLQIRGRKDMNVSAFRSPETERRELERYYDGGVRNLEATPEVRIKLSGRWHHAHATVREYDEATLRRFNLYARSGPRTLGCWRPRSTRARRRPI